MNEWVPVFIYSFSSLEACNQIFLVAENSRGVIYGGKKSVRSTPYKLLSLKSSFWIIMDSVPGSDIFTNNYRHCIEQLILMSFTGATEDLPTISSLTFYI